MTSKRHGIRSSGTKLALNYQGRRQVGYGIIHVELAEMASSIIRIEVPDSDFNAM